MAGLGEIDAYAEVLFKPERERLLPLQLRRLAEAREVVRKRNNSAGLLTAEAECYVADARDTVRAKAACLVSAYDAFHEACGPEAMKSMAEFAMHSFGGRKSAFLGETALRQRRTGQIQSLAHYPRMFDRAYSASLDESKMMLERQRVTMMNKPAPLPTTVIMNAHGPNSRNVMGDDYSHNANGASDVAFGAIRSALEALMASVPSAREASEHLNSLESAPDHATALSRYSKFLGVVSQSVTLLNAIGPHLGPVVAWIEAHAK